MIHLNQQALVVHHDIHLRAMVALHISFHQKRAHNEMDHSNSRPGVDHIFWNAAVWPHNVAHNGNDA